MTAKSSLKHALYRGLAIAESSLRGFSRGEPKSITNFLVLQADTPLGSIVHTTPLIEVLRERMPQAKIAVAVHGISCEIYRCNPKIDAYLKVSDPVGRPRACAKEIRAAKIFGDENWAMLYTAGNQRSGAAMAGLLARAPFRTGYSVAPELLHFALKTDLKQSQIERELHLLELFGIRSEAVEPAIYFDAAALERAKAIATEANPTGRPMCLLVTQVSGGQRTNWLPERFCEVMTALAQRGWQMLLPGTQGQFDAIQKLIVALREELQRHAVNLAGRTGLTELAALSCLCDVAVSLDTGTAHVARAAGLPLVVLGPCWQSPHEWLPVAHANARVLRGADCTEVPDNYMLDEIGSAQVLQALDALTAQYPPEADARMKRVARLLSDVDHLKEKASA